jgi:hypothetical protein
MMAGNHPNDIELLEYVEGDLDEQARAAVLAHLEDCETCAAEIGRLEHARSALQATPLLELPAGRRQQILESLPAQEREPHGVRGFFTRRRVLAVLAPVAVAAAVVIAIVSVNDGGTEESAAPPESPSVLNAEAAPPAEPAPAEPPASAEESAQAGAAAEDSGGEAQAPTATSPSRSTDVQTVRAPLSVGGTPEEVVARLAAAGLTARAVGQGVEVENATEEEVAKLLEDLGPGAVSVTVVERPG